jgi:hypothetical protein
MREWQAPIDHERQIHPRGLRLPVLFINGLVDWNSNRELVAEARATLMREIADNKKDLDATVASFPRDQAALLNAIKFADEMLSAQKTKITSLELHYKDGRANRCDGPHGLR